MKLYEINHSGQKLRVWAEQQGQNTWLHYNGKTVCVPRAKSTRAQSTSGAAGETGQTLAPMPGKILKVKCKAGDQVTVGQVLIVMEAMKMEYSLAADKNGRVSALYCNEGDQVQKDALLVKVDA